jgi:hypothetical protein
MRAHPLDVWQVLIEELVDARRQLHCFATFQRAKSTKRFRLRASVTLR